MARTIGSVIAEGWGAGRMIGDDIAQTRFARGATKIKNEYAERAAAEGKVLEDYLPDLERDLEKLGSGIFGVDRRGLTGRSGQAISRETAGSIYQDLTRASERRAGAAALAGDQAGARDIRARTQYGIGDFDAGQGQQIAGDTVRATSGAMRPDGTYDMAGGAQALAGVGARYGDAGAANAQQQGAETFRLQAARAKADALFRMLQNPEALDETRFAGLWEGFKESVPELQHVDARLDKNGEILLYTGGKVSGSLTPPEAATMLSQFTQEPGAALQAYQQARLKNIEETKKRDNTISDDYRAARIDVVKALTAAGLPADLSTKVVEAQSKISSGSNGWQLQDIGDEPGTFLMQKNGKVYTVKTNVEPNLETGEVGGTLQVFDTTGRPVPGSVLDREEAREMQTTLVDLASTIAQTNTQIKAGVLKSQLAVLNELEAQDRGLPRTQRAAPGNVEFGDAEQVQSKLEELGAQHGFKTTSTVRDSAENRRVRGVPNSQHLAERGTARDYSVKGKTPAEIEAFANALRAEGFEVITKDHGTGPHIHAELPPGARTAASPVRRAAAPEAAPMPAAPADAVAAASAPTARSALPPRQPGISPDYLRTAAADLQTMADEYRQKREALERFDADLGTQRGQQALPTGYGTSVTVPTTAGLTPEQARVRNQLAREVAQLETTLRAATEETRANTGALTRQRETQIRTQRENELYSRYGGAADFFSRAGAGGSQ